MSTAVHPTHLPSWDRVQRGALVAAVAGVALYVVAGVLMYLLGNRSAQPFFLSYLVGYIFWLGVGLGSLVILMLQYVTGGAWGIMIRRILESCSRTLVLLAVLFVPIFFGLSSMYLWAQPDLVRVDQDLAHKSPYLNVPFFIGRTVAYFAIWLALAFVLNRWSWRQDQEAQPRVQRRFRLVSGPGLALYGFTITFASIDWAMSLEPYWYSTIYPVLFAASQLLTGFSFAIAVLILLSTSAPIAETLAPRHLRALGSLLLAFVLFWAYMSFSQLLLIYVGNLPEEIPWYLKRSRGGWQWVAAALALFQFALPFALLLSRDIKENRQRLVKVAAVLLVMRFVDIMFWIEPTYRHDADGRYLFWLLDVAAWVGLGGVWVWWFVWQLKRRPLLPIYDPYYPEAVQHEHHA